MPFSSTHCRDTDNVMELNITHFVAEIVIIDYVNSAES